MVVDGATSDFIKVKSGVTQESVLGPCLFLVFINNLADRVASIIRLFADDTIVYRPVASEDTTGPTDSTPATLSQAVLFYVNSKGLEMSGMPSPKRQSMSLPLTPS